MTDDARNVVVLTGDDTDLSDDGAPRPEDSTVSGLVVSDDPDAGIYVATLGGVEAAGVVYARTGHRVTILATSVFPMFRGQGVAAALLSHVLDGIRSHGDTITITCPFTARFLESHPEYADLIDPELPGVAHRRHEA